MVGVAALVLAIPMSILANIFTPKVRDWWATTSKVRAFKRYKQLGREIIKFRKETEFDALGRFCGILARSLMAAIACIVFLLLFVATNDNYIAALNGMALDQPTSAAAAH